MTKATAAMQKSKSGSVEGEDSPSRLIDGRIQELADWRGETLARIRDLIQRVICHNRKKVRMRSLRTDFRRNKMDLCSR